MKTGTRFILNLIKQSVRMLLGPGPLPRLRLLKPQTISSVDIGTSSSGYELFKSVASIVTVVPCDVSPLSYKFLK